ncbi:esterase/lipase family protein [Nocardia mangyaensis]|uniref:esterase/lipase family protein n=1 Tax=Nocardia mangyaensis TaxID=2213200 RepID=UPI002676A9C8|nr:alpha/beta fold hydrolase [Nocardia mangyaensis]MDO3651104.1 alpha/beta fold hydrolase [Nocardia mangyaensis]
MRRSSRSLLVLAVALLAWGSAGTAAAEYPVDYNFFAGIAPELITPGGSLPGANDPGCVPSAEHPNPVVLLHGTGGGAQTNWGLYAPLLANEGYCVFSLTYGAYDLPWPVSAVGGMRPIEQSAAEVAAFVDRVLASTGATQVDFVAHSQGNIVGNYYIKRVGGADKVGKLVAIAPPWLGTNALGAADIAHFSRALGAGPAFDAVATSLCQACGQMFTGSPFLTALNADGVYSPQVTYTNIVSAIDELVVPHTSGLVPGPNTTSIVVQDGCAQDFSEHLAIAGSPRAAGHVLNALDPARQAPVPCVFVPPFTG